MCIRSVGAVEFHGIMKGTIPVCDEFGDYNIHGLAIVEKNSKLGVVNDEPRVIIPIEYDDVELLENGVILVRVDKEYFLHNKSGAPILHPLFTSKLRAIAYAKENIACTKNG